MVTDAGEAKAVRFGQGIARALDTVMNGNDAGPHIGFALLWFETGKTEGGRVNYVSNCDHGDMMLAMKEYLARAEGRVIVPAAGSVQ